MTCSLHVIICNTTCIDKDNRHAHTHMLIVVMHLQSSTGIPKWKKKKTRRSVTVQPGRRQRECESQKFRKRKENHIETPSVSVSVQPSSATAAIRISWNFRRLKPCEYIVTKCQQPVGSCFLIAASRRRCSQEPKRLERRLNELQVVRRSLYNVTQSMN